MKTRASSLSVLYANRRHHSHPTLGFTIVELLIVIVVIAILAAITVIAYNGMQQRANNTAIIDAASKSLRMIQSYIAANGAYPHTSNGGYACITTTTGCYGSAAVVANSTFDTKIATIGNVPRSVPAPGADHYGIYLLYTANITYNTQIQPLMIWYYLQGANQKCGVAGVMNYAWPDTITSATGYTTSNFESSGKTLCWVSIPGPSA